MKKKDKCPDFFYIINQFLIRLNPTKTSQNYRKGRMRATLSLILLALLASGIGNPVKNNYSDDASTEPVARLNFETIQEMTTDVYSAAIDKGDVEENSDDDNNDDKDDDNDEGDDDDGDDDDGDDDEEEEER